MPELPEVEVVRKTLEPHLINHKITKIKILMNKIIKDPDIYSFQKRIVNQTIHEIQRKGKLLIIVLDDDVLLSHLRMEGKYFYQKKEKIIDWKHVLLILELDNGYQLQYHDTRRFGTFHLQEKTQYQKIKPYTNIGPEPWQKEVTINYLLDKLKNKRQVIKTSLLNQSIISGLGNIYVDEVLFASKIHPETPAKNLKEEDIKNIINNSINILNFSIKVGGSTIASYTSSLGVSGKFQNYLKVHTRENQACFSCKNKIKKIKVNNRGTYFCSYCQTKK